MLSYAYVIDRHPITTRAFCLVKHVSFNIAGTGAHFQNTFSNYCRCKLAIQRSSVRSWIQVIISLNSTTAGTGVLVFEPTGCKTRFSFFYVRFLSVFWAFFDLNFPQRVCPFQAPSWFCTFTSKVSLFLNFSGLIFHNWGCNWDFSFFLVGVV